MSSISFIVALIAGLAAVIQSTFNAIMVKQIGFAGAAFLVGIGSSLFSGIMLLGVSGWNLTGFTQLPLYVILGAGLAGVAIIGGVGFLVSTLGVAGGLSFFIIIQLVLSVIFDHFGIFVSPRIPADPVKIAGLVLMIVGFHLVLR